MKIKYYFNILLLGALITSCSSESALTPSMNDKERLSQLIDMSKPLVAEYKNNYKVNILYNFDDTLDFKFGFHSQSTNIAYGKINITELKATEDIDYSLDQLNKMVLQFIKPSVVFNGKTYDNCPLINMLPYKILIADIVELGASNPDNIMGEWDRPEEVTVTAIGSPHAYLFAFNRESMEKLSDSKILDLRNVKLYCFLSYIFELNNLYDSVPKSFYQTTDYLRNKTIEEIAQAEDTIPSAPTGPNSKYYYPEWYMGKGFALTVKSPNPQNSSSNYTVRLPVGKAYLFPGAKRDFRAFLNVMINTKRADITRYYASEPVFKQRMQQFLEIIASWGIDVLAINPDMEVFNQ